MSTHLEQAEALNKNATHPAAGTMHAIIEHLKEQKEYGMWQLCPMCHGHKDIPNPYSGTAARIPCTICNGFGMMVRPEIKKEERS